MKPFYFCALFLGVAYVGAPACSLPRPFENETLGSGPTASTSTGGMTGSQSPSGGAPSQPPSDGGTAGAPPTATESPCGDGPSVSRAFSKKNLLRSVGECAALRYCEANLAFEELADVAASYEHDPGTENKRAIQEAAREALAVWSRAELFQFGPAASATDDPVGGVGLRDLIYSWPFISRCRVEEQVFGKAYDESGFDNLVKVPVNSRGLFAVEYLSFYEGSDTACTQFSIVNVNDAWSNTSSEALSQMKREYLQAVTADVLSQSERLTEAWSTDGGNYGSKLANLEGYMNQQEALNLVAQSLLYIEVEVKDYKLGAPAGLYADAPLERPEGSFSLNATALIQENLRGFRDLFFGCNGAGLGFDDWLIEAGHQELADEMATALDHAESAVNAFPELSSTTPEQLAELHAEIKKVTSLLKSDLFGQGSPIGLTLPSSVEGDTD